MGTQLRVNRIQSHSNTTDQPPKPSNKLSSKRQILQLLLNGQCDVWSSQILWHCCTLASEEKGRTHLTQLESPPLAPSPELFLLVQWKYIYTSAIVFHSAGQLSLRQLTQLGDAFKLTNHSAQTPRSIQSLHFHNWMFNYTWPCAQLRKPANF